MWKHPLLVRASYFFLIAEHRSEDRANQQWSCDSWSEQAETTTCRCSVSAGSLSFLPDVFPCESGLTLKVAATQQRAASGTMPACGKMHVCSPPFRVGLSKLCVQLPLWLVTAARTVMQHEKNGVLCLAQSIFWPPSERVQLPGPLLISDTGL